MRTTLLPPLVALVAALAATSCGVVTARHHPAPALGFDPQTPCARLGTAWRDHDARGRSPAAYWRGARVFVERALSCGDAELAFTGFMIGPSCGDGPCRPPDGTNLGRLERAGVPLKAAFAAWLTARDLSALGADIAYARDEPYRSIRETMRWLVRSSDRTFARAIANLGAAQRDPYVQVEILEYFVALGLPEGEPIALHLLSYRDPELRLRACDAMRRLGSPTSLPAVRTVAATDAYSQLGVVEGMEQEVFPVRARCAAAVETLAARARGEEPPGPAHGGAGGWALGRPGSAPATSTTW